MQMINVSLTSRLSSFNLSTESSILLASIKSAYFSVKPGKHWFNNNILKKKPWYVSEAHRL